ASTLPLTTAPFAATLLASPRAARGGLGAADGLGDLVDPHPQLAGDEAFVARSDRRVADGGDDGCGRPHGPHAAFDGRQVEARDRLRDRELEERSTALDEVADCRVPGLLPQIRGIATVRLDRDEGLRDEALLQLERLERGLLPGLVAVEREDDLAGPGGLVAQQTAHDLRVLLAE